MTETTTAMTTKELLLQSGGFLCKVDVTATDTMADVRAKALEEIDENMLPSDNFFIAIGDPPIRLSKKQESTELAWDVLAKGRSVSFHAIKKCLEESQSASVEAGLAFVLEYLSVKDVCSLQMCSKAFQSVAKEGIEHRAKQWKEKVSLGWACGENRTSSISADDVPFEQAKEYLEAEFVDKYSNNKEQLLENIAKWCGGWGALLHVREICGVPKLTQQPQWNLPRRGEDEDPKPNFTPGPLGKGSIVLIDIHLDGAWKGSIVIPTCRNDGVRFTNGGWRVCDDGCILDPVCSVQNGLGDEICVRVEGECRNTHKSPSYLFSADPNEQRKWHVSVSVVSPFGSETFLGGKAIVPRNTEKNINALLDPITCPLRAYQSSITVRRNCGNCGRPRAQINVHCYWDTTSQSQPRFHALLQIGFEFWDLLQDILMRPPPGQMKCPCGCNGIGFCYQRAACNGFYHNGFYYIGLQCRKMGNATW